MPNRSIAPVQYYGGKGSMLKKLSQIVPPGGAPYCEPYCGGASLFFSRFPAPVEVLNDLDGDVVNLFRCIQDKSLCEELERRVQWTLYSRAEFGLAIEILNSENVDPVLRAWAFFVSKNQGFSGEAESIGQWSRSFTSTRGMARTVASWTVRQDLFYVWRDRLRGVQIDNRDALEVIRYWDCENAIFYIDPPYILETRNMRTSYNYEMDLAHHNELVDVLLKCTGAIVLSGYAHEAYAPLEEAGWERLEWKTACHATGKVRKCADIRRDGGALAVAPRTEVVWRNARAAKMCGHIFWADHEE